MTRCGSWRANKKKERVRRRGKRGADQLRTGCWSIGSIGKAGLGTLVFSTILVRWSARALPMLFLDGRGLGHRCRVLLSCFSVHTSSSHTPLSTLDGRHIGGAIRGGTVTEGRLISEMLALLVSFDMYDNCTVVSSLVVVNGPLVSKVVFPLVIVRWEV
jgi:hypothetical protein